MNTEELYDKRFCEKKKKKKKRNYNDTFLNEGHNTPQISMTIQNTDKSTVYNTLMSHLSADKTQNEINIKHNST